MKTCMAALALGALAANAAAQVVYKCEVDGRVSYGEQPCAQGRTTVLAPPVAGGDAAAAQETLARQQARLAALERARLAESERAERARLQQARADARQRKRCEGLRLKARWAREDAAGAGAKARPALQTKAKRERERLAVECPD